MSDDPPAFASVCSVLQIGDDEEYDEVAIELSELDFPDELKWDDLYISPDEPADFEFVKSNGIPEPPDRGIERTVFEIDGRDNEEKFHIHIFTKPQHYEDLIALHNSVITGSRSLQVNHSGVSIELSDGIDQFTESIATPSEGIVRGVEWATSKGFISIFQESDRDYISVTHTDTEEDVNDVETHIEGAKSMAQELLEGNEL
jgi:hypothetical protein